VIYYAVPLFIFSIWLSIVTFLHHTHKDATIYGDSTWSFYLGSLMTVDRSYGAIVDYFQHNIETHVIHHMFFTSIPHYRLVEATEASKEKLKDVYFYDPTPILSALYKALQECSHVVEVGKDVYQYVGYDPKTRERPTKKLD